MIPSIINSSGINEGAILFLLFVFIGVPIIGIIIALSLRHKNPKAAKIIGIVTAVYALISFGFCSGTF
jgi:hypothetical protein